MGVFFRPRRPLMRVPTGAVTHNAGQRRSDQQQVNQQAEAPYPATQVPLPDSIGRLERLANLHDSGALTDTEFAAAKARLLGGRS